MSLDLAFIAKVNKGRGFAEVAVLCKIGAVRLWRSDILVAIHVSSNNNAYHKRYQIVLMGANNYISNTTSRR
jgi:hypothetical protein